MVRVSVEGQEVGAVGLQYSNVDPGGFETASFTVTQPTFAIHAGDDVTISEGPQVAWQGRVEEPGRQIRNDVVSYNVNAVGYGAELKEEYISMVYVDSDLNAWTDMTVTRKIALLPLNYNPSPPGVTVDPGTGVPAIETSFDGAWGTPVLPISESLYDAGVNNQIGTIILNGAKGTNVVLPDANWFAVVETSSDPNFLSPSASSGNIMASSWITILPANNVRYALVQFFYNLTAAGTDSMHYNVYWSNISVYGDHGLPIGTGNSLPNGVTGALIRGLYASDIFSDVARRGSRFEPIVSPNTQLVTQLAYKVPTLPNDMFEDLRKLTGWHWGVWEPESIFSNRPTVWFTPPPPRPTVSVLTEDCTDLDVTETYSNLHDKVVVSYTDPNGTSGIATYSNPNPRSRSGRSNTLNITMGNGTASSAATYARYVLLLDQLDMRAAGSCQLPTMLSDGRPAHLIKAGRDKIKIIDYPTSVHQVVDTIPVDTFHISRVTVSVTEGVASTQIEFDQGADLIEVLQARLAQGGAQIGL